MNNKLFENYYLTNNYNYGQYPVSTCNKMSSLLNYFQRINRLPNPNGSLSASVSTRAIVEGNRQFQKEMDKLRVKRGAYKKYVGNLT